MVCVTQPPPITSVSTYEPRPLWSVVIPAHNCAGYLSTTLGQVVEQLGDAVRGGTAEIIVVDDGSVDHPESVVREIGGDLVRFERNETALGAVVNFNLCLSLTRGEYIHLLHGDDAVLPGFYAAMQEAVSQPDTVAAICRTEYIDENDSPGPVTRSLRKGDGRWETALHEMSISNLVRPSAIVARRSAYEQVGGFRTDLPHAADWEAWTRLCAAGPVNFVDRVLARYRRHSGSDTARRVRTGANIRERVWAIDIIGEHIAAAERPGARRKALAVSSVFAARTARDCLRQRDFHAAGIQVREGLRCLVLAGSPRTS